MNDDSSENLFFSESLREVLDEEVLLELAKEDIIKEKGAFELVGKFFSLSKKDNLMTVEVSPKIAKFLLENENETFAFSFMEDVWFLKSHNMFLEKFDNEKFKATLEIVSNK